MSRRLIRLLTPALLVAACGGAPAGSPAASQSAAGAIEPTSSPTAAAVTNPPPTPIPGCLPQCWFGHLTVPGALSGAYTTRNFFGGQMTVTVPDGWYGYEDSTGELSIGPVGGDRDRLEFWIDVYVAKDPSGTQDESFERSADGIIAFVKAEQGIDILKQEPATLGGLPAEAFVYRRAKDAVNMDPGCPAEIQPCIFEFGYPEWDGSFSEGGYFHSRLVIAKASWGGQTHSVYAMFWADDASFDYDASTAQSVVEGARLPAGVEPVPIASLSP